MKPYQTAEYMRTLLVRKQELILARFAWILVLLVFLRYSGGSQWGDVLLLGLFMGIGFLLLMLPADGIKPRPLRLALFVVDLVFLCWGMVTTPGFNVLLLGFLTIFWISAFFARNIPFLTGLTVFVLLIAPAAFFLMPTTGNLAFLPEPALRNLVLLEGLIVSMAYYLGILGLPLNSLYQLADKFRLTILKKGMLIRYGQEMVHGTTTLQVLRHCADGIIEGVPGARLAFIREQKGRTRVVMSVGLMDQEEFALDTLPGLKQCVVSGETITTLNRSGRVWAGIGSGSAGVSSATAEMFIPVCVRDQGEASTYLRVARNDTEYMEEEKEYILGLVNIAGGVIRLVAELEKRTGEGQETGKSIRQLRKDNQRLQATATILSRLNCPDQIDGCLDQLQALMTEIFGNDSLFLFVTTDDSSMLELLGQRVTGQPVMPLGTRLPVAQTLVGKAFSRNAALCKNAIGTSEDTRNLQGSDVEIFSAAGIHSLILLPLTTEPVDRPFGVMALGSGRAETFQVEHLEILGRVNDALSVAVERAWHQRQTDADQNQTRGVLRIIRQIVAQSGYEKALPDICLSISEWFGLDICRVMRLDENGQVLILPDAFENETTAVVERRRRVDAGDALGFAVEYRQAYLATDSRTDPYCIDLPEAVPSSRVVVPLLAGEQILGVLDSVVFQPDVLNEDHKRLLETIGDVLAQTLLPRQVEPEAIGADTRDELTGLLPEWAWPTRAEQFLATRRSTGAEALLLLVGVEDLNEINAAHGRTVGDALLKTVASAFRGGLQDEEIAARSGGSEMAALLLVEDSETALAEAQRRVNQVAAIELSPDITVRVSAGAAFFPRHGNSYNALWRKAQAARDKSRQKDRNQLCLPEADNFITGDPERIEELYREVVGESGKAGPHTVAALNELISRLVERGLNDSELADLLYRLVLRLDYPDDARTAYPILPEMINHFGQALNLGDSRLQGLLIAARIYDIGKFAMPQELLYAPRPLDDPEMEMIQRHVNVAVQDILKFHRSFHPILGFVKFHHERWDGTGYPWKLKQEEIPIESRILGLVDALKALVTDRPYRRRLSFPEALQEIVKYKAVRYDPQLVTMLAQGFTDGKNT